jgi:phage shock protein PspC (stress-responsive transcriptional regulator)
VNEVLGDFERSIAEKCAGVLQTGKNFIGMDEMKTILKEMGPVSDDPEPPSEEPAREESKAGAGFSRKLYKQPHGAKLSGVCSGLAEHFGIDPVFLRIGFIVLSLFAGLGVLIYILLEVLMPSPAGDVRKRYRLLKIAIFGLALTILYLLANSQMPPGMGFHPPGMFGLRFHELFLIPIMMGIYLLPILTVILLVSLVAVASIKYLRSGARGRH